MCVLFLYRFFARLSEGNWNLLCIRHEYEKTAWPIVYETRIDLASQAGQSCAETFGTAGYDPPQMIVIIGTARVEVLCKAQQGRSGVKRKIFGCFRNKMGNEPILALPKGSDNFIVMREARAWWFFLRMLEALGVRDEECDLDGSRASTTHFQSEGLNAETMDEAEIGESKLIGLEMEQETTKVVVIKERLKEARDRVVRFGKKGELAPRTRFPKGADTVTTVVYAGFFARLSEGNWNLLCIRHESEKMAWPIVVRHEYEKTAWPIVVRHAYVKMA
nr:hypothetical protein [Tanacetum cinerariifolium]